MHVLQIGLISLTFLVRIQGPFELDFEGFQTFHLFAECLKANSCFSIFLSFLNGHCRCVHLEANFGEDFLVMKNSLSCFSLEFLELPRQFCTGKEYLIYN